MEVGVTWMIVGTSDDVETIRYDMWDALLAFLGG